VQSSDDITRKTVVNKDATKEEEVMLLVIYAAMVRDG
jgi:hypothetical protein